MSERNRSVVRLATTGALAAAVGLLGTGCSAVHQQIGDAWSVTYEVRVDQPQGSALTDVRVEGAEERGGAPEVHRVGSARTDTSADGGSSWKEDLVVLAEQRASVRATPAAGATATCRILLDGEREIAKETAAPGKTVRCSVDTPRFG